MVHSGTMKSSPHRVGIQISSVLGALGPLFGVHGILSKRGSPSTFGMQARAMAIDSFGSLLDSLGQRLKKGFSCLVLEFLLVEVYGF